jgi:FKBP-type peptidyl-prolyl cis-trans isomerase FklB
MKVFVIGCFLMLPLSLFAQSKKELQEEVARLKTEVEALKKPREIQVDLSDKHQQASYALGILLAGNLRSQGGDSLDAEAISAGIKDYFLSRPLQIEQQQCLAVVQPYMQAAMESRNAKLKAENLGFLEHNKTLDGITVTPTGLQYKVLRAGSGLSPGPEDSVTVHYKGKLIDGTVFDESAPERPISFAVSEVIAGWTEALLLMREGDKWELYLPYPLAYGERGAGSDIPPYATLVFEIELLKVNKGE